jgi:dTDP-4-amino-4,6-dideoxygalactose transaminase
LFYLLMPSPESRRAFIDHMRGHNISSAFHYLPLHLSKMGIAYGGRPGDCPVTERVSELLVRLPFFTSLTETDQDWILEAIWLSLAATVSSNRAYRRLNVRNTTERGGKV